MKLRTLSLAMALALLGCSPPAPNATAPAASTASVTAHGYLHPTNQDGRLLYLASVTPWTTADIDHVVLTLRDGDTTVVTTTVAHADLAREVSFSNLKQNTSYTLLAQAYRDPLGAIEIDDAEAEAADCTTSFSTTRDPNVAIGDIVLRLADKTYSGTTEGASLAVTNGQVVNPASGETSALVPAQASVLAGSGMFGFMDGSEAHASFATPMGLARDSAGNLYVADSQNYVIREITPAGMVGTFAGMNFGSADGTGTAAQFRDPYGLAADSSGNLYVADTGNNEIRKITPAGVVTTLAGSTNSGSADGTGVEASFNSPYGVAVDARGTVYVADTSNNEIRKITPGGSVSTLAGSPTAGDVDGTGAEAALSSPSKLTLDAYGNLYVSDRGNAKIREVTSTGVVTTLAALDSPGALLTDLNGKLYATAGDQIVTIR